MVWNKDWKVVLGYSEGDTFRQVQKKYFKKSLATHPTRGGTTEAMQNVTQSWLNAQAWFERPHKRGRNENTAAAAKRHRANAARWNRPAHGPAHGPTWNRPAHRANAPRPTTTHVAPRPPPRKFVVASRAWNAAVKNAAAPQRSRNNWVNGVWERAAREVRANMRRPGKPTAPLKAPVFRAGLTAQPPPRKMYVTPAPRAPPVTPPMRTRYASAGGAARPGLRPRKAWANVDKSKHFVRPRGV